MLFDSLALISEKYLFLYKTNSIKNIFDIMYNRVVIFLREY